MKFKCWLFLILLSSTAGADKAIVDAVSLQHPPVAESIPSLNPPLKPGDRNIDNNSSLMTKTTQDRPETNQPLVKKLEAQSSNLIVTVLQNTHRTVAELNADNNIKNPAITIRMNGMNADTRDMSSNQISQSVRTLEGQSAYINTGKVQTIQNISLYGANATSQPQNAGTIPTNQQNGYPLVSSNTQMQEADSGFSVTPHLSGQQVILDISSWSERFHQGNNINRQSVHTTLRANLGEWIQIAGDNSSNQSQKGRNAFNRSTLESDLRIMIKVDKAD